MSLYDAFKDALSVAQKSDNIDLYKQLLDLSSQALDLQEENQRLRNEIDELKRIRIDENRVVRHNAPYITLEGDSDEIKYCSRCWDVERKLVVFCKCKFLKFADKNGEVCISVLEKVAGCPAGLPDAS